MGLFSFIKDAGAKLFGGKTSAEKAAEAAADRAEEIAAEKAKAEASIVETINDLELHVENLSVSLEGDTAIITGKAQDQATKEKVVLVVGNTQGIAMVNDQMDVEHKLSLIHISEPTRRS